MKLTVVTVGGTSGPLAGGIAEYESRAGRYWNLQVKEVGEGARGGHSNPERIRSEEGRRLLKALTADSRILLLTRAGKGMTSEGLARYLERQRTGAGKDVAFVIGGAWGVSADVEAAATFRLSLSPMTLPHEMARLLLVEQIYRAGTILRGEPYHKGPGGGDG